MKWLEPRRAPIAHMDESTLGKGACIIALLENNLYNLEFLNQGLPKRLKLYKKPRIEFFIGNYIASRLATSHSLSRAKRER